MVIRKSEASDIDVIMDIYASAREFMALNGNPNQWWKNKWPPRELILEDIKNSKSYVCINEDRIVGVFYFDYGIKIEPTYNDIYQGEWMGTDEYGVVHRIASDKSVKGIGTFCLNWAYEQCHHLRIDTHFDNYIMQNCLEKLGFIKCGIIYVEQDNDPRIAYEK